MLLKVNGSEGTQFSFILLILGCFGYFLIAISTGSLIPIVDDKWASFSVIPSSWVILAK